MKLTLRDFFGPEASYLVEVEPGDERKRLLLTISIEGEGLEAHPQVLSLEELGPAPKDAVQKALDGELENDPLPPQGQGPTFHGPTFPGPLSGLTFYDVHGSPEPEPPEARVLVDAPSGWGVCAWCGNSGPGHLAYYHL